MGSGHDVEIFAASPRIFDQIIPGFSPHGRLLIPGSRYLETLAKDNVESVPLLVQLATKETIITEDGKEGTVNAIICATSANVDLQLQSQLWVDIEI